MRPLASIITAGCAKYGRRDGLYARELLAEALDEAFENCPRLSRADIDAFYLGQAFEAFEHQANTAPSSAGGYGFRRIPAIRLDSVSSSGASALRQAVLGIRSGEYDVVIAAGVEKMTHVPTSVALDVISMASDRPFEQWNGVTLAAINAMMARMYLRDYKATEEHLAMIAVKNHRNGFYNPKAHLRRIVTVAEVLASKAVATPLKLLDCSPISDGASCVVLCRPELAARYTDCPVDIVASAEATDLNFVFREQLLGFEATRVAAAMAYAQAEASADKVDLFEVHDAFTINELLAYEDLGMCAKGSASRLLENSETSVGGRIPVNPSGGLKSKGHPVGSSGTGQAYEIFLQLTGRVEPERAVKGAHTALSHSMGGAGESVQVHVYRKRG